MQKIITVEMKEFKEWFDELRDNKLWHIRMKEMFPRKNLTRIAMEVHAWLIAKEDNRDMPSTRALFQKFAKDAPDGTAIVNQVIDEPIKGKEWVPLTGKEREDWLSKWKEMVEASPLLRPTFKPTSKQLEEEGQVRPKATQYHRSDLDTRIAAIESVKHLREARRKTFLTAFPDAIEEEIQAYIMKFDDIDNPNKLKL